MKPDSQIRYAERRFNSSLLIAYALAAVIFVAMLDGLQGLLPGHLVMPFIVALAVQMIAVESIRQYKTARANAVGGGPLRGIRWLCSYAVCVFLTVGLSYSFFYRHFQADKSARAVFDDASTTIMASLDSIEAKYALLQSSFSTLATASRAQDKRERNEGNTCGFPSKDGIGPVQRFRNVEAELFARQNTLFEQEIAKLQSISLRARAKRYTGDSVRELERELSTIATQINSGFLQNPMLASIRELVIERSEAGDRIPGLGKKCDDPARLTQLKTIHELVKQISEIPPVAQRRLFDPMDIHDLARRSFAFIIGALSHVASGHPGDIANMATISRSVRLQDNDVGQYLPDDLFPLLLAVMFDGLLFVLSPAKGFDPERRAFVRGLVHGERPLNWRTALHGMRLFATTPDTVGTQRVEESLCATFHPKYRSLWGFLCPHRTRKFLVIPNDRAYRVYVELAFSLARHGDAEQVRGYINADELPVVLKPAIYDARGTDTGEGLGGVQVWMISNRFFEWLISGRPPAAPVP